jgi:hypothetical protein
MVPAPVVEEVVADEPAAEEVVAEEPAADAPAEGGEERKLSLGKIKPNGTSTTTLGCFEAARGEPTNAIR